MSVIWKVSAELKRFGEDITITTEEGVVRTRGFVAPLLYKNKMYLAGTQLPEGFCDGGHYLFILPPDVKLPILGTAFFQCKDEKYVLKRSEKISVNSRGVYVWAVVTPFKETLEDDSDET